MLNLCYVLSEGNSFKIHQELLNPNLYKQLLLSFDVWRSELRNEHTQH